VTDLFPSRDKVVPFVEFRQQRRNGSGVILKIGVHGDDDLAPCIGDPYRESRRLAVVPVEPEGANLPVLSLERTNRIEGTVGAAVVDKDDFEGIAVRLHHRRNGFDKRSKALLLIVERNDDGKFHAYLLKGKGMRYPAEVSQKRFRLIQLVKTHDYPLNE
jgi:hypothetical protein